MRVQFGHWPVGRLRARSDVRWLPADYPSEMAGDTLAFGHLPTMNPGNQLWLLYRASFLSSFDIIPRQVQTHMCFQLFGNRMAILAIACVLGLFLFPAARGPYSAVHGPVTALRSLRAGVSLRWAIAAAAFGRPRNAQACLPCFFRCVEASNSTVEPCFPPGYDMVLRC